MGSLAIAKQAFLGLGVALREQACSRALLYHHTRSRTPTHLPHPSTPAAVTLFWPLLSYSRLLFMRARHRRHYLATNIFHLATNIFPACVQSAWLHRYAWS